MLLPLPVIISSMWALLLLSCHLDMIIFSCWFPVFSDSNIVCAAFNRCLTSNSFSELRVWVIARVNTSHFNGSFYSQMSQSGSYLTVQKVMLSTHRAGQLLSSLMRIEAIDPRELWLAFRPSNTTSVCLF